MTYHGGKIVPNAATQAIFWGTTWGNYSGDEFTGYESSSTRPRVFLRPTALCFPPRLLDGDVVRRD
jgi:hypothetical protein